MKKGIETKYLILHGWERREQKLRGTGIWKWKLLLALVIGQAIASVSRTKVARSHWPITLPMWMFSTMSHHLVYSLTGNRNFARKEELIYETNATLTSNAGHLGWQQMPSFTKWCLWCQNTIPLMHCDHLVGNRYFVPFFVFYTESVMLGPRFIPESIILYPVRNA